MSGDPLAAPCRRTCTTCCAWIDNICANLVAGPHDPGNRCELHETVAEYAADLEALKRFRIAIGLAPRQEGNAP